MGDLTGALEKAKVVDDKNKEELESTEKDVKDALKTAKDGDSKIKISTVKDLTGALEKAKVVDSKDKKEVESAVKDMSDALKEAKDDKDDKTPLAAPEKDKSEVRKSGKGETTGGKGKSNSK